MYVFGGDRDMFISAIRPSSWTEHGTSRKKSFSIFRDNKNYISILTRCGSSVAHPPPSDAHLLSRLRTLLHYNQNSLYCHISWTMRTHMCGYIYVMSVTEQTKTKPNTRENSKLTALFVPTCLALRPVTGVYFANR